MEIIKCPQCGESDLIELNPGEYKCKVCGATIRNDKVDEILELLKTDPDNFIGNIKYRLSLELNKSHLDIETIRNLADKILDRDPEDIFATFLLKYADRKKNRSEYKDYLNILCNVTLQPYKAKQIGHHLVHHYEGYYKDLIVKFLESQNIYGDLYDELTYAINNSTNEIVLKDPYVKRDVFVVCDMEDFNFATNIVDVLNDHNISTWFEPVNFDYDSLNRNEQVLTAAKNTKLTLVMNSSNFRQNKELRLETNKIIDHTLDEDLDEHGLTRTISFNIDCCEAPSSFDECLSYNYTNYESESFVNFIRDVLHKLLNKEYYINSALLEEIVDLRKSHHFKKALRRVEDLLEEDLESEDEVQARLEALRCLSALDDEYSDEAFEHANKIKKMVNHQYLAKYEEELPILLDERQVYNEGISHLVKKEFSDALECFIKASKKDYPNAYNKIGEMYFLGRGVEPDTEKAVKYFNKASKMDCVDADRMLGMMYLLGNRIDKNEFLAFKHLQKGADKNNAFCALKVAQCYNEGIGTVKDDKQYYKYLKIAARGELPEAIRLLGKCFKYGKGTPVNKEYARKCFEYAAAKGDFESRRELMEY